MTRQSGADQDGLSTTRRHLLGASVGFAMTVAAGCLGGDDSADSNGNGSNGDSTTSSSPSQSSGSGNGSIESIKVDGKHLVVNVADDPDVKGVRLLSPGKKDKVDREILDGSVEAELGLLDNGNPVEGGTYIVETINGNAEAIDSQEISLHSKPVIKGVKIVKWDGDMQPQVTIENQGKLPCKFSWIGFPKNVPDPRDDKEKGMDNPLAGAMTRKNEDNDPIIGSGKSGTFLSEHGPFKWPSTMEKESVPKPFKYPKEDFSKENIKQNYCQGDSVDTTLVVIVGGGPIKIPATVTYAGGPKIGRQVSSGFRCKKLSAKFHTNKITRGGQK